MADSILETARLRLEPWTMAHLDGLAVLGADARVMRYLGGVRSREETAASIERQGRYWGAHGFGWWVIIDREIAEIVGAGCIQHIAGNPDHPIEIGWRLRPDQWGRGLATEAARAMGSFAFDRIDLAVLLALADQENTASQRVMQRLGMRYRGIEPWYDTEVVTYAIDAEIWRSRRA